MDFEANFCKVTCYIFWLLIFTITILFIAIGICTNQSTTCQWISAIGTLAGAIFTAVVGFFAYRIAKEQNHSAKTSLGMSVSRDFAANINKSFEEMFDFADMKCADNPKNENKTGMEYPSNVVTALIVASDVFEEISEKDYTLNKKFKNLLIKQLKPLLIKEIQGREVFIKLLRREIRALGALNDDQMKIFRDIDNQYDDVASKYNISIDSDTANVNEILDEHNAQSRAE